MQRATGPLFAAALIALCGCAGKETPKADTTTPAAAMTMAKYDPATHSATIHAKDFSFDAPDSLPAGWTSFHLVNDGPGLHHAQIVRIDSGKTFDDFMAAVKNPGPPPKWVVEVGGPNAADPGAFSDAVLNLAPGNYAILCFVDTPDKVAHFTKGMTHRLTVTAPSGTPAAEPASDASATLSDFSFTIDAPLTSGRHTIKVVNKGPAPHELELVRLEPGKTVSDMAAFLYDTTAKGPPPGHAIGGVGAIAPGATAYTTFDLQPGNYAMLCFVTSTPDNKMHLEKGMIKEFTIK